MTFRTNEAQRWGGDIEVLLDLLDRWTEEVFPASSRSTNDSLILVALWRELADVLYQYHSDLWDILVDEIEQGLLTPDKANPPTRALAQSLSQLMRVGLREAFLVGAIRQAMDQLVSIAGAEPANAWHRLADAMVPASVQIEFADDESLDEPAHHIGLTDSAADALSRARAEAARLGADEVVGGHALLALISGKDTVAARALDDLGVDMTGLRAALEGRLNKRNSEKERKRGNLMRIILESAGTGFAGTDPVAVTTGDILVGLLEVEDGDVGQSLAQWGVDAGQAKEAVARASTEVDEP